MAGPKVTHSEWCVAVAGAAKVSITSTSPVLATDEAVPRKSFEQFLDELRRAEKLAEARRFEARCTYRSQMPPMAREAPGFKGD